MGLTSPHWHPSTIRDGDGRDAVLDGLKTPMSDLCSVPTGRKTGVSSSPRAAFLPISSQSPPNFGGE